MKHMRYKWPSVWDQYGVPRHAPRFSQRWSEANIITYISQKPMNRNDIEYYFRVTPEHALYLELKANYPKLKAWLKE